MTSFRPQRPFLATLGTGLALLCTCASIAAAADRPPPPAPDKLPVIQIRDLSYGDGLFYFYQGESFESLTRLEAYSRWGRLPNHDPEAQLLLGGLYLELGMHNEAGARFERLLGPDVPLGVRNRAWFYLAKVWYAKGYDSRAQEAAGKLNGVLPPEMEAERLHLLANVLMRRGRFGEAADLLDGWQGQTDWTAYARFNLGAALIRDNQLDVAARYLTAVGQLDTTDPELLALRDRSNLTLGFAYLQAGEPVSAKPPLQRVRLNGPYSSRALLGAGWADAELGDFKAALTPWLELREREILDPAVQESFLAIPYAFAKLEAPAQAAEFYEAAMTTLEAETQRLDAAIARVGTGSLLDTILQREGRGSGYGWFYQLKDLPDAPESRYLYAVFAGHDFQEGLKNYRDLAFLDRMLSRWSESFGAYSSMIDTREKAFGERLPKADQLLAAQGADSLQKRRDALSSRLDAIAQSSDVAALGSQAQRDQWQRIAAVGAALAAQPESADVLAQRERLRLVKGALYWRLAESFRASMFAERRQLRELDGLLRETQDRTERLTRARASVPTNTGEFGARLDVAGGKLQSLQERLAQARERQGRYLTDIAIRELTAQKERLAGYRVQARFALASIYDRAALPKAQVREPAATGAPETATTPAAVPTSAPVPVPATPLPSPDVGGKR